VFQLLIGIIFAVMIFIGHVEATDTSYMSLKQFRELESGAIDKSVGSPLVTIYLGGSIEALGLVNAILEKNKQAPLFCMPASGLTAQKVRVLIESYIQKNRNILSSKDFSLFEETMNVGAATVAVLMESYPCK